VSDLPQDRARQAVVDRIRDAVAKRRLTIVVGEDVDRVLSGGHEAATWDGLLGTALTFIEERGDAEARRKVAKWRRRLDVGLDDEDAAALADAVQAWMTRTGTGLRTRWLQDTAGCVPVSHPALARQLSSLSTHFLTTSLHTALARATELPPTCAQDAVLRNHWLREGQLGVLHLNGHVERPEKVVLGTAEMVRRLDDPASESVLRTLWQSRTLLFVGHPALLDDPRLRPLLDWAADTLDSDPHAHLFVGPTDVVEQLKTHRVGARFDFAEVDTDELVDFLALCGSDEPPSVAPKAAPTGLTEADLLQRVADRADQMPWLGDLLQATTRLTQVGVRVDVREEDCGEGGRPRPDVRHRVVPLWEAVAPKTEADRPRHVLVGEPGSGKSTLLRQLVPRVVEERDRPDAEENRLPVLVHVQRVVDAGGDLYEAVCGVYGEGAAELVAVAEREDRLLVLLDGFDEALSLAEEDTVRRSVHDTVRKLVRAHPEVQVVVASRPEAEPHRLGFARLDVHPLEPGPAAELLDGIGLPDGLTGKGVVKDLLEEQNGRRAGLARSPLLLTLVAAVLRRLADGGQTPEVPNTRAEVYDEAVEHMLARTFAPDGKVWVGPIRAPTVVRRALIQICGALHAHPRDPWPHELVCEALYADAELLRELKEHWGSVDAFLTDQARRVGLLVRPRSGRRRGWMAPHRTLREYLAAQGLVQAWRQAGLGDRQPTALAAVLAADHVDAGGRAELLGLFLGEVKRLAPQGVDRAFGWLLDEADRNEEARTAVWRAQPDVGVLQAETVEGLWACRRSADGFLSDRERDVFSFRRDLHTHVVGVSEQVAVLEAVGRAAAERFQRAKKDEDDNGAGLYQAWRGLDDLAHEPDVGGHFRAQARRAAEGLLTDLFSDGQRARIAEVRRLVGGALLDGTRIEGRPVWAPIPAGTFWMGSKDGEGFGDEKPAHIVDVQGLGEAAFHALAVPVTRALYSCFDPRVACVAREQHPVTDVSWYEAALFAAWLAALDPAWRWCRLPTETEWEYACRGVREAGCGPHPAFWSGDSEADLERVAWTWNPTGHRGVQPVGRKQENPFGMCDVHGNVVEWCAEPMSATRYEHRAGLAPYPYRPPARAPSACPSAMRAFRGGSWRDEPDGARVARRAEIYPHYLYADVGFRLVLAPPLAAPSRSQWESRFLLAARHR